MRDLDCPWIRPIPADLLLDWIDATSYIKNLKETGVAALAWGKVLLKPKRKPKALVDILDPKKIANINVLRQARVRLDVVAMLVYRLAYASLAAPSFYLWTDSSPPWKGLELCASSFDVYECGAFKYRLFRI
mgnify:CR=1 FL=1